MSTTSVGDLLKDIEAKELLLNIPEAKEEMEVYIWWWEIQGREDLAKKAKNMVTQLQ